jgi:hypothetical protein
MYSCGICLGLVFRHSRTGILTDPAVAASGDLGVVLKKTRFHTARMEKSRRSLWLVLGALAVCLLLYPINTCPTRLGTLLLIAGAWAASFWRFRNRKSVRLGLGAAAVLTLGFLVCPGRHFDQPKLHEAYLEALRSYTGTPYVWGGENKLGIDCSGLVRAALIKASIQQGLLTLNPGLARFGLSLWWHDCSAQALGEEYRGQTKRIISARAINTIQPGQIEPGDLAVTATGVHVLAFLGGNEWIEADPAVRRVIIVTVPAPQNPWFTEPVKVMRWTELRTN